MHVYCGCGYNFVVASCLVFSVCGPRWGPLLKVSSVMCCMYKGSPESAVQRLKEMRVCKCIRSAKLCDRKYMQQLAKSIDHALQGSLVVGSKPRSHVFKIVLVKGM